MSEVYTAENSIDSLIGRRIGRLTVLPAFERRMTGKTNRKFYLCLCECGTKCWVSSAHLRSNHTKSCGCLQRERQDAGNLKHGLRFTPEYNVWAGMLQRCYYEKHRYYKHYGARGITVCDEWRKDFAAFYRDMGPRPSSAHSLDRIKNDQGYCKENCKWSTPQEQQRNTRQNRLIEWRGESKTLIEWSEIVGLDYGLLRDRLDALGWAPERAFTEPVNRKPWSKRK